MVYNLRKYFLSATLAATALGILGCGGSDTSLSGDVSTAYLVDSNVSGVSYSCGTQSGITGSDGSFKYQHGKTCTFSIGATSFTLSADKLAAGKSVTPLDVFNGDDEKAINLARMLQTLDSDGNPDNGIEINATARAQITQPVDFGPNFDANISAALNGSTYHNQIRSRVKAIEHMAPNIPAPTSYSAFERIAEIDLSDVNGSNAANSNNPTTVAKYVARHLAKYFYMTNDTNISSGADWVLGGAPALGVLNPTANIAVLDPYILEIPSPDNNKTMIVEVCNKTHAGGAMMTGVGHSPALPCEIAIYMDAATNKIYIDILDPVGSFKIFFNDLTQNQAQLAAMALQVKTEIKLIAYDGLKSASIAYLKKSTPMGATFSSTEIAALSNQYIVDTYDINTSASDWNSTNTASVLAMASKAAQTLITKMTVNGVTSGTYGINGTDLNTTLVNNHSVSANGYWRSARSAPLSVPRSTNTAADGFVYTVEACSPTYAKLALSMGGDSRNHATALPCQMSFYIDNSDANAPKLKIVYLNPVFMFQTLFKDKMGALSANEQTTLGNMAETVKTDLINITRYVMDHSASGWIIPNTPAS